MSDPTLPALPLRSLLFHFSNMELFKHSAGAVLAEEMTVNYMLLIFKSGSGTLFAEERCSHFSSYSTYLLPPNTVYQFESTDDSKMEYYQISFQVFQLQEGAALHYDKDLFPDRQELRVYPLAQWIDLLNQLYIGNTSPNDIEAHRQQLQFQKLIGFLFEHNLQVDRMPSSTQTVEQTIQYMQTNFQDNITVKQLAHMANVPAWQFTSIFKELTGKKPLDYLTELRINRSKEWLLHTENPLRDIAERVGFTDEYYFSRRFRLMTGYSPRQYAISMRQNILVKDWNNHEISIPARPNRIYYYGESTGDIKTLGIPLVGKDLLGKDTTYNLAHASNLKPDLIIFDHKDEGLYTQISQIAPTLAYNSRGTLDKRLLMLGNWFGKKRSRELASSSS